MPPEDGSPEFHKRLAAYHDSDATQNRLALSRQKGTSSLSAWFLGPLGENQDLFQGLVSQAIGANCDARRQYAAQFGDPPYVTEARKASDPYQTTVDQLQTNFTALLDNLHGSIPLSSYRNQSHMYWDVTLPGMAGYFAAMLYNQNNVAPEASPVTTLLEIEVGRDLCEMLGYTVPSVDDSKAGALTPWGHITCDGSVANGEAMWAARNLKYLPVSLAAAIREDPAMAAGKALSVATPSGGRALLVDLDTWSLLNLGVDEVIALSPRLQTTCGIDADTIEAALSAYSVQALGLAELQRRFLAKDVPNLPVVIVPATAHYSWPKSAALLGLGFTNLWKVPVDLDGRMDLIHLRRMLAQCLHDKRPVMQVVAVMGTTEESAVDPLADIVAMRDEFRAMGLEFALHVDGAWGGYFNSILREPRCTDGAVPHDYWLSASQSGHDGLEHTPSMVMSDYVMRQYAALSHADSQTVDPHKGGFIPYPAGALCYRNGGMRDLIAFTAPVVFHGGLDPTVGVYGIEGSKPGAAAAGVYLSHSVIRPDKSGYGKLLGKCIFNSKRLYAGLVSIGVGDPDEWVRVIPFQRLPAEKAGLSPDAVQAQRAHIKSVFVGDDGRNISNDELVMHLNANPADMELFRNLGSDQNIVTYALNFRTADGWNDDLALMNELTLAVYRALSISEFDGGHVPKQPMFVTSSSFQVADYGQDFVSAYAARAGVTASDGQGIEFLVSTTQDPWITGVAHPDGTAGLNYLPQIIATLKDQASLLAKQVMRQHGLAEPKIGGTA